MATLENNFGQTFEFDYAYFVVISNHGNHRGINRTWRVLEGFYNKAGAEKYASKIEEEIQDNVYISVDDSQDIIDKMNDYNGFSDTYSFFREI